MACDTPLTVIKAGEVRKGKVYNEDVNVPCGKCPPCKMRKVREWVFRLEEEDRQALSSKFITLTYDTLHVPISKNGFMTLCKQDLQKFFKRLRKLQKTKIKYYACGEYGTHNNRPHFHIILFNLEDDEHIHTAWTLNEQKIGEIHIGNVSGASIAYTTKYIDKPKRIPMHQRDDRLQEFSLMSKGLGLSFITPEIVKYYHDDITRLYVSRADGVKTQMPKIYRNRIFTEQQRKQQLPLIQQILKQEYEQSRANFKHGDYDERLEHSKRTRYTKFYNNQKSRNADS